VTTPLDTAWAELLEGNRRFIEGDPLHPHQDAATRHELAEAQHPSVTIFGCSDSRLAAEIIFDLGLGDAFVVRNAGQVVSTSVLGTIEYAVAVLGVPLIVVLGHDNCGAVRAAIESQTAEPPSLPPHIAELIAPIAPAVHRVIGDAHPADADTVDASEVGREHLRDTVAELIELSEVVSSAVAEGRLAIVGANYRLDNGRVEPDIVVGLS
jgi:carbonic anhydrase